ncbi:hypothetical protein PV390_03890 [Streptomyces sp. ME02-6991-2A]|uniref:hypothetical protein n=1 Tax=Streptomyces sp. ME02-6991-2A TaxID=3028677 RepID=UPI001008075A|nr:hypothetical protein [Streptomyces sp. ME02-6991-2A]MDX3373540.1 hypothetical protein [Streptomyces sp. ME02-6991-2A]
MLTSTANRDSHPSFPPFPSFWPRVREFAVPALMVETATARREAGDWAGACAAAGFDIDFRLRTVARGHGRELAARIRADLRHLAPDLLRWHMPRIAPHGLLRPGLTIALARYDPPEHDGPGPLHLVVRTPPAWAEAGQRISLALWDGSRTEPAARRHPHPHPNRRYRLDLHRHLWDARRSDELRIRSGTFGDRSTTYGTGVVDSDLWGTVPPDRRCAVSRWEAEAAILLGAEGKGPGGTVSVRLGGRHRVLLHVEAEEDGSGTPVTRIAAVTSDQGLSTSPVLPDAATWVLPDLDLLRTGAIEAGQLHPLVARALVPNLPQPVPASARFRTGDRAEAWRLVQCRGAQHRIGLVEGVLAPLDHDPAAVRREELLVALTGTPLPCLQAIDEAHRRPDCLTGVRERLDHGDIAGALAAVEGLLGPEAVLRDGPLRDELEAAAQRRITYGLFRADLLGSGPGRYRPDQRRRDGRRPRPHRTTVR